MISFNGANPKKISINGVEIKSVYMMGILIWSNKAQGGETASCFGSGVWLDDYPWTDDIPWVD